MRILPLALLLALAIPLAPASAAGELECVSIDKDVACDDVAVSVRGSASGGFLALSGTGDATTYMDRCLEWICPSVAVSGYRGDAYAECHASSVCVAVAGFGHASHEGTGYSLGTCDYWLYALCYPVRTGAPLLP
jgi:hypothetical protein